MTRKDHRRGGRVGDAPTAPPAKKARTTPPGQTREARPPQKAPHREGRGGADFVRIYGFHAVSAALRAPRRELIRLYATEAAAERLAGEIASRGVETKIVAAEDIAVRTPRDAVHQGVLLEARPLAPIDISELPPNGLVLALDQITDPHNVGAILRTAAAFAVDALVTTERHTPEFTGALAKSASGGLEHVPICSVVNLARALDELGDLK
jgi:23S rRNA (guanosine2251-2'-O)-methyltransferase